MSTEATPEFAMTWTWLREPSPPDDPVADCVSFAFMSCLTCFEVSHSPKSHVQDLPLSQSSQLRRMSQVTQRRRSKDVSHV
jgi:hypothetical protein